MLTYTFTEEELAYIYDAVNDRVENCADLADQYADMGDGYDEIISDLRTAEGEGIAILEKLEP